MPLDQTGSNTASNDSAADWMRQYRVQKRRCDEENGVLRNIVKRAKADGMNTTAMIAAVKATKLEPEVVSADLRDQIRYMGIIHLPMTQASLFEGIDFEVNSSTEHKDDLWTAEDAGYRAGRHGQRIEDCPYQTGTELHVHWVQEWHKGQAAIARELGPDVKVASANKKRKPRQGKLQGVSEPAYVPTAARKGKGRPRGSGRSNGGARPIAA
jgi:ribosome modulation factor